VNAKVFDGTKLQDWTSVRFADGLITECSAASAAREGDEVIDAAGGTVLPGLIDAHVHLVPGALAQSLTFGVTTVLDMFSKPGLVASAKEQAGSRPDVADVRSSGVGATAPGGHPSMMYAPFPTLTAADQAGQFVAERIAEGSDYLKIISGTGGLWPSLDSGTIKALVTAAHARGLVVVAHVSSTAGLEEVVSPGVDVVAHVPRTPSWTRPWSDAWPRPESWSARRWPPSRTPSVNRVAQQWQGTRGSLRRSGTPGHAG
jgi:hypothetical protein